MKKFLLFIFIFLTFLASAADDEKYKSCEKEAYGFYPVPNYSPRRGGTPQRGPGGFDRNYKEAIPTLADDERAKQKREQYIKDCMEKE